MVLTRKHDLTFADLLSGLETMAWGSPDLHLVWWELVVFGPLGESVHLRIVGRRWRKGT